METPNCEKCRYRLWLEKLGDTPPSGKDCGQYGQTLCRNMNDPQFLKWMDERNGKNET